MDHLLSKGDRLYRIQDRGTVEILTQVNLTHLVLLDLF